MSNHNHPQANDDQRPKNLLNTLGTLREFYSELQTFADLTSDIIKKCSNINCNSPSAGNVLQLKSNTSICSYQNYQYQIHNPTLDLESSQDLYEQEESCSLRNQQAHRSEYISKSTNNCVFTMAQTPERQKLSSLYISLEVPRYPTSKYQSLSKYRCEENTDFEEDDNDSIRKCVDKASQCSECEENESWNHSLCESDSYSKDDVLSECCSYYKSCDNSTSSKEHMYAVKCCEYISDYASTDESLARTREKRTDNADCTNPIPTKNTAIVCKTAYVKFKPDDIAMCSRALPKSSSEQNIRNSKSCSARYCSEPNISSANRKKVEINFFLKKGKHRKC